MAGHLPAVANAAEADGRWPVAGAGGAAFGAGYRIQQG